MYFTFFNQIFLRFLMIINAKLKFDKFNSFPLIKKKMTTTLYINKIPTDKRLVYDENQKIKYHYISFFESNFNNVDWKIFDPMLKGKTKKPYRFDNKTWEILNFTKWKVNELDDNKSIKSIEAMDW